MTETSRMRLILASASPRRRDLLERLGVPFSVAAADIDETPLPEEAPARYVARVAGLKAAVVAARDPQAWILAADTTVVIGDQILGKPADEAEAAAMLVALAGRTHQVMTGTWLLRPGGRSSGRVVTTDVVMRALGAAEIARHTATGDWRGKAGGYAAQGLAAAFITEIHGSYTNVVGLPLAEVAMDLAELA